jgi:D-beta-D-heptose 7-phosphate kinase/D-beta-D-heptose 1-phosphate adenosyltransferase
MIKGLSHIIDLFKGLDVVVIGESMLDVYLEGTTSKLCREAPVPVIAVSEQKYIPGGAANTAINVARLGSRVTYISMVGEDSEGVALKDMLEQAGIATACVFEEPLRSTITKNRIFASSQMMLRFDQGSVNMIDSSLEEKMIGRLAQSVPRCDALIVSDYGYGVLTPRIIEAIGGLQKKFPRILVVDAKHPESYRAAGVTAVKPNYTETVRLLGIEKMERLNDRVEQITAYEEQILTMTGAQIAAVTLDTEGAVVFERGKPAYRTYARPAAHSNATGAGDTFVSALTLALSAGASTPAAAELASAAASVVVSRQRTAACSAEELLGSLSSGDKYITSLPDLGALESFYHSKGQKVIFTNGCFDILHRGHVTYLSRAKSMGDVLIVGVNSDAGVSRIKGPARPINVLEDRLQVLLALSCVDHVIGFDEDTPEHIIRMLHPDVYVKGGDYTRETLPEVHLVESLGGKVCILPYLQDTSTTGIINRIRGTSRTGQEVLA